MGILCAEIIGIFLLIVQLFHIWLRPIYWCQCALELKYESQLSIDYFNIDKSVFHAIIVTNIHRQRYFGLKKPPIIYVRTIVVKLSLIYIF